MTQFNELRKFIIVNNASGKHNAFNILYNKLMPCLCKNISYIFDCNCGDLIFNTQKYLTNKLIDIEYDIIIILGGDGTVHTVINMLINNNLDKPICHIPCGTGNGLSKSLHYAMYNTYISNPNTSFTIDNSIQDMLNYDNNNSITYCSINIFDVSVPNTTFNKYGFLSLTWGLFSSIDIKTEWLRKIGSLRNTIGALWELFKKESYRGTLQYENEDGEWTIINDEFYYLTASNVSHVCEDVFINPDIKMNDGYFHLGFLRGNVSRYNILKLLLSFSTGTCDKYLEVVKTRKFKLKVDSGIVVLDGERIDDKFREFDVKMSDKSISIF
jgi:sphingosine kinase